MKELFYTKKILFFLLILLMPYVSLASMFMDTEDYDGSTIRSRTHLNDFRDVSSFSKQSASSQFINLEDSQNL